MRAEGESFVLELFELGFRVQGSGFSSGFRVCLKLWDSEALVVGAGESDSVDQAAGIG